MLTISMGAFQAMSGSPSHAPHSACSRFIRRRNVVSSIGIKLPSPALRRITPLPERRLVGGVPRPDPLGDGGAGRLGARVCAEAPRLVAAPADPHRDTWRGRDGPGGRIERAEVGPEFVARWAEGIGRVVDLVNHEATPVPVPVPVPAVWRIWRFFQCSM